MVSLVKHHFPDALMVNYVLNLYTSCNDLTTNDTYSSAWCAIITWHMYGEQIKKNEYSPICVCCNCYSHTIRYRISLYKVNRDEICKIDDKQEGWSFLSTVRNLSWYMNIYLCMQRFIEVIFIEEIFMEICQWWVSFDTHMGYLAWLFNKGCKVTEKTKKKLLNWFDIGKGF